MATVTCPLGPRVRSFVGRKDSSEPSPDGLMPGPFDSADKLIGLFSDKTISPDEPVFLVGAHTTAQQQFVDTNRAGDPLDGTPGVWDVAFYDAVRANETQGQGNNTESRVFRLQSDINLSQDPRTSGTWNAFTGPRGQGPWNGVRMPPRAPNLALNQPWLTLLRLQGYARAYIRLSFLGVNNINDLKECTKVLPTGVDNFQSPDKP